MNLHDLYTHCLYPHHAECIETRLVIMYTGIIIMHYCKKKGAVPSRILKSKTPFKYLCRPRSGVGKGQGAYAPPLEIVEAISEGQELPLPLCPPENCTLANYEFISIVSSLFTVFKNFLFIVFFHQKLTNFHKKL